jgi:hypothetical protein
LHPAFNFAAAPALAVLLQMEKKENQQAVGEQERKNMESKVSGAGISS